MTIPEYVAEEFQQFENQHKPNLEETEIVNLGDEECINEVKISVYLNESQRRELIHLLTEYIDVFVWVYSDMLGLSTNVVSHKLPINSGFSPMKQKALKFKPELSIRLKKRSPNKSSLGYHQILMDEEDAIKAQALADHLAENLVDKEYEPLKTYFHDEYVSFVGEDISETYLGWRVFFDRAANHQGRCIRAVLVSEFGQHYPMSAKLLFNCTNNMAEYEACILGLKMDINMNVHEFLVIGDSDLTHNELADVLATISSMIKHPDTNYIDPLDVELKEHVVHCSQVEVEPDGLPWYFDIHCSQVEVEPDGLPWRTPDLGLLRCVDAIEDAMLFEQIHVGVCGMHMNGLTLARKILQISYFWMTIEHDCGKFVKKCHKCQVMDFIGPIDPSDSNGHKCILVAIDYITKWVEAASYKSVTKKVVVDFVRNNLICRFGVPESIITDNGENLKSYLMRDICEQFKITHLNSAAYRPQMNGAVEAANKNIKKILRKMIENHRGWHKMLPYALLVQNDRHNIDCSYLILAGVRNRSTHP
ncbi:uncharacterized protein LOC107019409 [Solanum pennellii]|uniref:Uncharacterized protein LOC107019409 n=1 Tax=Solanum pennellii TaxID=28526 RepID=A0ABM1GSS3_SOLPN|nr:uncharacterized protein LOC107019409 [Solanum pennellii]